ncbi:MAG: EF-hand domain-containing protein [Sedimenticola sp.]|nr:EF-hand domain-containing protein [Sedimenticola sp.]
MSKKILAALLAAMATAAVIAAENKSDTVFDVDNNGTLSMEEAKAIPGLSEQWDELDVNKDGQLDPAEFSKFVAVETKPAN